MTIDVRRYDSSLAPEWNNVLSHAKNSLFLFDRGYMDYHADRFVDMSAIAYLDGKAAALLPASLDLESAVARSHGGLTFGGIVLRRDVRTPAAIELVDRCLDGLRDWGAKELYISPVPEFLATYPSGELHYALWQRKFITTRRQIASVLPVSSALPFNSSRKQAVARARKAGLTIVTGDDVTRFHDLLTMVLRDRHGTTPTHSKDELELLMNRFPEYIKLMIAERDGALLSGALVYRYPTTLHTQYLAVSPMGRDLGALDLIIAEVIEETRRLKLNYFSFGSSMDGEVMNGSLLWQKESFGARTVLFDTLWGKL